MRPFKIYVEATIRSVSSTNISLDPSQWVLVRTYLLGYKLNSRLLTPRLPLRVDETLIAEKTFAPYVLNASRDLIEYPMIVEVVQLTPLRSIILGRCRVSLSELLYGYRRVLDHKLDIPHLSSLCLNLTLRNCFRRGNLRVAVKIRTQLWEVDNLVAEYIRDGGVNTTETRVKKCDLCRHISEIELCQCISPLSDSRSVTCYRPCQQVLTDEITRQDEMACLRPRSRTYSAGTPKKSHQLDTVASMLRRREKVGKQRSLCVDGSLLPSDISAGGGVTLDTSAYDFCRHGCCKQLDCVEIFDSETCGCYERIDREPKCQHEVHNCSLCCLYNKYFGESYPRHCGMFDL